jgi:hypothetical protein
MSQITGGEPRSLARKVFGCLWNLPFKGRLLFVLFLIGCIAIWWEWRSRLKRQIAHELASIREKGEPVSIRKLAIIYQSLPKSEDAAGELLQAFAEMDLASGFEDIELPLGAESLTRERLNKMENVLRLNQRALAALETTAEKSGAVFILRWEDTTQMAIPYLADLKRLARLLRIRAGVSLFKGDKAAAIKDVHALFHTGDFLSRDPLLLSYLVRVAICRMGISTIELILNNLELNPAELKEMQREALSCMQRRSLPGVEGKSGAAATNAFYFALLADRAMNVAYHENLANVIGGRNVMARRTIDLAKGVGFGLPGYLSYLRQMDKLIETARGGAPEHRQSLTWSGLSSSAPSEEKSKDIFGLASGRFFFSMLIGPTRKAFEKAATLIAGQRMAILACEIELYHLELNSYPERLDEMHPRIESEVLRDPFNGEPFHYQVSTNGFALYSVGPNLKDNGGSRKWGRSGKDESDIVFEVRRQAAIRFSQD